MTSLRWPYLRTVCLTLALLAGVWLTAHLAPARAASTGQLQQQIGAGQGQISNLRGAVHAAAGHVAQINANIAHLQGQINRIQANLDAKRAELLKLRTQLTAAKIRLRAPRGVPGPRRDGAVQPADQRLRERPAGHRQRGARGAGVP